MVASKAGLEKAGSDSFTERQGELFDQGFSFSGYERDMLQINRGDGSYFDISGTSGIDSISDGRGAVFADFDNDGDTDVFLTTIQGQGRLLFRNNLGADKGWLRVSLKGTASGTDAYGTVVRIGIGDGIRTRLKSGGSGYNAQRDPRLLFGLGEAEQVDWLEVTWPSGEKTRFESLPANRAIEITEGKETYKVIEEKRFSLPDPLTREETRLAKLHVAKGAELPKLILAGSDGKRVAVSDLLEKGKIHLLNVWATWCMPCAREMPVLQGLQVAHADKLRVIGLSLDEAELADLVRKTLRKRRITYSNYRLDEAAVKALYTSRDVFVPLSIIVDGNGVVRDIFPGWNKRAEARLTALLE